MTKYIGLVAFLVGCSGGDVTVEHEDWREFSKPPGCYGTAPDAGAPAAAEDSAGLDDGQLGVAQEALTVPGSYGSDENSQRCTPASTKCKMPVAKRVNFREFLDTTCTGNLAPRYHASYIKAIAHWQAILPPRGWLVELDKPADPRIPRINIGVQCGNASTFIATTTVNCDMAGGNRCKTGETFTKLDQADIEGPAFVGASLTKQKDWLASVIEHEQGHALGLGHYTPSVFCPSRTSPSDTVMVNAGCSNPSDATTYIVRTTNAFEQQMLNDYIP